MPEDKKDEIIASSGLMAMTGRTITIDCIKREMALLNKSIHTAKEKYTILTARADNKLADWIYENNLESWSAVEKETEQLSKEQNKEDDVILLLKMKNSRMKIRFYMPKN